MARLMMKKIVSRSDRTVSRLAAIVLVIIGLSACGPDSGSVADNLDVTQKVEPRVESYLREMMIEQRFAGVALVARNGQVVHANGYGRATTDVENTVETAFHVASVTKQFTAAAIMQLVEQQVLRLDESINAYLPEHYRSPVWQSVTIHHLLSHSSGITDYALTRPYYDVVDGFCLGDTVDGMIREAMAKDLEFAPGTEHEYSNIGFTLLGIIIEQQTDTPYAEYLRDNILDPLGMFSSRVHIEGHVPVEHEASGHRWDDEEAKHVKDDIVSLPVTAPDGGLVTTLRDFLVWSRVYVGTDDGVLSQASLEQMTSPQIAIGRGGPLDSYGYGLYVGDRLIGHAGYIVGFRSFFVLDRETDTLIAVFTNNITNNPQQIVFGLLDIVFPSGS